MSATLTAGIASLVLNIDQPMEADLVTPRDDLIGVKVWVDSSSAAFTPSETNLVFDGNSLSVTIPNLSFGVTYYVKYALISDIEPENYVVSSALSATPLESTYEQDTTPAPTPTGVTFTPAFSTIIVEHDAPTYTAGHGHSRSVLFGKIYTGGALPTFSQSTSIAEFTGRIHSFATEPSTTWRLWIVWVTKDGAASTVPYGGTNGIEVKTGEDVGKLLTSLSGEIRESELYSGLTSRIDLIDGPSTLVGSVNSKISGVQAQINTINAELATINQTPTYSNTETYVEDDIVSYNGGLYKALQTTTGNLPTNTTYWQKIGDYASLGDAVAGHALQLSDHETRISTTESGLTAEVSARQQLAAQVATNTAGIQSEATARANADSALSSTINSVSAVANAKNKTYYQTTAPASGVTAGDLWFDSDDNNKAYRYSGSAWVATDDTRIAANIAAITAEQTARANADSALSNQITTLTATVNSNNTTLSTAIQNEATARADADGAQASQIATLQSTVATRGAGAALNADPGFSSSLAWVVYSGSAPQFVSLVDGAVGKTAIRSSAAGVMNWVNEKGRIPVNPEKAYRAQGKLRTVSGSDSFAYLGVALFDADGNNISGDGSQWYYFASNQRPGAQWVSYSGEFGAGTSHPFPSNARTMAPLAILSYGGGSSVHEAQDLRIEDLTDVKLLTASIQTEATTRATQTGELYAKYGVKLDVNGYVTGWAMNNNGSTGDMIVLADKFAVGAPGGGSIIPFVVNTTPQTINGVTVPAGTYMDAAYIKNGTITNAKIGNAAIDDAKIANLNASKITAGTISADRIAAGSIVADKIDSRGLTIKDANGTVILSAGNAVSFKNNLADVGWWNRDAAIPWSTNAEYNRIIQVPTDYANIPGPKGGADFVWYCEEVSNDGEQGGGWNGGTHLTLDTSKTYRFVIPIRRISGSGQSYWGTSSVCDLNTESVNGNPYFAATALTSTDRWYLFVGYVYPYGSRGNTHDSAGIWDCKTGLKVSGGSNWNFGTTGAIAFRAYQYYATQGAGQMFGRPLINLVDGTEPALREYFENSAVLNDALVPSINSAATTANWTNVSGRPTSLSDLDSTAATALAGKLSKAGDTITGRINLAVADGIFAGSDTNNGVYMGNGGLVGKKNGTTTFAIDTAGNATFAGTMSADSITSGTISAARLDSGVITAKVANLTGAQIADLNVDRAKLANNSISTFTLVTAGSTAISGDASGSPDTTTFLCSTDLVINPNSAFGEVASLDLQCFLSTSADVLNTTDLWETQVSIQNNGSNIGQVYYDIFYRNSLNESRNRYINFSTSQTITTSSTRTFKVRVGCTRYNSSGAKLAYTGNINFCLFRISVTYK